MALGVHSEVGTLRRVMVHRPGPRAQAAHARERRGAALRRRALGRARRSRSTTTSARSCASAASRSSRSSDCSRRRSGCRRRGSGSWTHVLNEREVGIGAAQRAAEWIETRGPDRCRRLSHRRHHEVGRRPGPRARLGVVGPDVDAAAAAPELPVPARPVLLDLRRGHHQPHDQAGAQARDDDHGDGVPVPSDVHRRRTSRSGWVAPTRTGDVRTSRAATCNPSATAP